MSSGLRDADRVMERVKCNPGITIQILRDSDE